MINRTHIVISAAASAVALILAAPGLVGVEPHSAPAVVSATIVPRKPPPSSTSSPTPSPTAVPIVLMSVGDSLTYGIDGGTASSYRLELSRLLRLAGVSHTWNVQAIGGTKCHYWAQNLPALLDLYRPALVFLDCGTNDTPTDATETDYRTILAAAQARGIPVVASLIGRPDPDGAANITRWPTIDDWMDGTNTAIRRALAAYPAVPYASTLRVPNNAEWLQSDGVHWTTRAEAAVGQLFYQAAQAMRGWPTLAALGVHEMCGLSGHDRDDRWPPLTYPVCRSE
jgi:lysophospholipase L1-like esterase